MRTEPEVLAPVVQELAKHNALTLTTRRDRGRRRLRWDDWSRVLGPALLCPLGTAAIGITRLTPCQGARELRFFERSRRVAAYGELCGNGVRQSALNTEPERPLELRRGSSDAGSSVTPRRQTPWDSSAASSRAPLVICSWIQ